MCLGKGDHRRLPADVRHVGVRRGCSTRSSDRTSAEDAFFHGHSYGGNALAASVALEHLHLFERWDVLGTGCGERGAARAPPRTRGSRRTVRLQRSVGSD